MGVQKSPETTPQDVWVKANGPDSVNGNSRPDLLEHRDDFGLVVLFGHIESGPFTLCQRGACMQNGIGIDKIAHAS